MKKLFWLLFIIMSLSLTFVSCKDKDNNEDDNSDSSSTSKSYVLIIDNGALSYELNNTSKNGSSIKYTASLIDEDGNVTHDFDVTWKSSDDNVASFSSDGTLSIKTFGIITITATATVNDKTYSAAVPLIVDGQSIFDVVPSAILAPVDDIVLLLPVYVSSDAQIPDYSYSSSDASIAEVSSLGEVFCHKEGFCTITVTANIQGHEQSVKVPVQIFKIPETPLPVSEVKLNKYGADLLQDESVQLTAKAYNIEGEEVTGKTFEWTTSNSRIATVDQNGKVTPQGPGVAYVKATCDGMFAQAEITVYSDTTVIVEPFWAEVNPGDNVQFTAKAYKTSRNGLTQQYNVDFTWYILDYGPGFEEFNVGTIDQNGLVTVNDLASPGNFTYVFAYDENNQMALGLAVVYVKDDWKK